MKSVPGNAITFDFDTESELSIHNATGTDFLVQKMGIITSLCNTRRMKMNVTKICPWQPDDDIDVPIMFGNAFITKDDDDGENPKTGMATCRRKTWLKHVGGKNDKENAAKEIKKKVPVKKGRY